MTCSLSRWSCSDNFPSVCLEIFTTCPPNSKRSVPTMIFLLGFVFAFVGSLRAKTAGYNSVEADWLLYFSYQAFGSLVVLICAVWLVDGLHLISLFCVGDSGEATGWWYLRRLNGYYKTNKGYTRISSGGSHSNVPGEDNSDGGNLEADDDDDDMEQEREKAKYLNENRREAKQRLVLVIVFYAVWTGLSACTLRMIQYLPFRNMCNDHSLIIVCFPLKTLPTIPSWSSCQYPCPNFQHLVMDTN